MKTTLLGGEYLQWPYGRIMTEPHCRNAVDFGIPLLNNPRCAQLFVEALEKKIPQGGLRKYTEGRIPSEVRSWREFVGKRA